MNHTEFGLQLMELHHVIKHLYQRQFHDVLKKYTMTQMEMDIVLFLANNPQYDTATALIKIRALSKSHVSASVDALVKRGFIQRHYDNKNHKVIHLVLTIDAMPLVEEGRQCQEQFIRILHQNICEEELESIRTVFQKITENAGHAWHQK